MHSQKFLYSITIPFLKGISFHIGYVYLFFAVLVIVGSSNAVNLTDGLDGLAIGPVITCCLALLILSYVTGNAVVAKYLYYYTVPGSGELCIFLSALTGASVGFLWFNTFPAQIFMGDSGAYFSGAFIGLMSIELNSNPLISPFFLASLNVYFFTEILFCPSHYLLAD